MEFSEISVSSVSSVVNLFFISGSERPCYNVP